MVGQTAQGAQLRPRRRAVLVGLITISLPVSADSRCFLRGAIFGGSAHLLESSQAPFTHQDARPTDANAADFTPRQINLDVNPARPSHLDALRADD